MVPGIARGVCYLPGHVLNEVIDDLGDDSLEKINLRVKGKKKEEKEEEEEEEEDLEEDEFEEDDYDDEDKEDY